MGIGEGPWSHWCVEICLAATCRAVLGDGSDGDADTSCCVSRTWRAPQIHLRTPPSLFSFLLMVQPSLWFSFFWKSFWCELFLKSLLNLLQRCLCFRFWVFGWEACGILGASLEAQVVKNLLQCGRWGFDPHAGRSSREGDGNLL